MITEGMARQRTSRLTGTRMLQKAKDLFLFLIEHLRKRHVSDWQRWYDGESVQAAVEDAKLSYQEALAQAGVSMLAVKAGHLAGQIALFCQENGLPMVNSVLVNSRTREVGDAYLGGDPKLDLLMALLFEWSDRLVTDIDQAIIVVPTFKNSYWRM
jgi:hypothetical protein